MQRLAPTAASENPEEAQPPDAAEKEENAEKQVDYPVSPTVYQ